MTPNQLDAREQRFVEEYLLDLDPKRSAIAAGYAKTTASTKSFGWVSKSKSTKPHVVAAIREALAERSERLKIEADWVLQRLIAEAEADLAAIYNKDGTLKLVDEWPVVWRKGLVTGLDVSQLREGGEQIGTVTKIRMSDRIKRIELIGKHIDVQAFAERTQLGGIGGGPVKVKVEDMTNTEAARLILATLREARENQRE